MTQYHSLHASTYVHSATHAMVHATECVLEGSHRWGRVSSTGAARATAGHTRLIVYPPDTTSRDRRALQFYRHWPVTGILISFIIAGTLSSWSTPIGIAITLMVYAIGFITGYTLTSSFRERTRQLVLLTVPVGGGCETVGDVDFFNVATDRLRAMDKLNDHGQLSPAEYTDRWAMIYNALPAR
ncbi:MAG: hypothetical protein JWQ43_1799 [Glaciihabitans sp.]|nr:hypothetical protein [Glaciihabitans sp.]